jgi:alpha-methylacyl-CoA racemase
MTDTPAGRSPDTDPAPGAAASAGPLQGLRVLDFTTLLPGPLATLLLVDAGATVLKIEPPGGDPVRHQGPFDVHGGSVSFQLLNRGKQLRTLDLKSTAGQAEALRLARDADVLVEQFRPGVMERLGLGPAALAALNPRLVYCSITGYGQSGANARRAGHDLNYVADAGLLANTVARDGAPVLPPTQIADIGGGSWPAVINILLALRARDRDGRGCRLDISMADNVWPFQVTALAKLWASGGPPAAGREALTGGLARYHLYETRDGRWLALGALEDRFFARFAEIAGLRDAVAGHGGPSREQVARRIREQSAEEWLRACAGEDVCLALVRDVGEAVGAATLLAARAFDAATQATTAPPPLPLPIDASLRARGAPSRPPGEGAGDADWPPA